MVYWTYNPLNMFRALLCPSSGARAYTGDYSMWHITLCLKPTAPHQTTWPAFNKVLCATCCNHLYSLKLLTMGIIVPETCWADHKFNKPLSSIWSDFFSTYQYFTFLIVIQHCCWLRNSRIVKCNSPLRQLQLTDIPVLDIATFSVVFYMCN
jgi:hypothetical protein